MSYLLTQRLQLIRINILPNPLHIIPIRHNAMLQRIFNLQQPPQLLRPIPNERVAFEASSQHARVFGSADEGREVAFGQVLAGVACADGAAAVVDYYGCVVEVGHGLEGWWGAQGEEVGGIAGPVGLGEVLLIVCMELERLECGKAPPKYIGCLPEAVCMFCLHSS